LSELDIINCIMRDRWRRNLCMPTWTPPKWWECDVFELTEAGYFREYEIKLSRSDFLADRRKRDSDRWYFEDRDGQRVRVDVPGRSKHELLSSGDIDGPTRFWFVTPEGLLDKSDIPHFAGLIEVRKLEKSGYVCEREVVKAPKIHNEKRESLISHAHRSCYYRMHDMIRVKMIPKFDLVFLDDLMPDYYI